MHLRRGNPEYTYRMRDEKLESRPTGRDMRVLMNNKVNMSQQHALADERANHTLGYIRHSTASQLSEVTVPLCSVLVWPHVEYCVQF